MTRGLTSRNDTGDKCAMHISRRSIFALLFAVQLALAQDTSRLGRSLARFGLDPNGATHQFGELPRDDEAEAGSAVLSGGRRVGLGECPEHSLLRLGREADAGVFNRNPHRRDAIGAGRGGDVD